MVTDVPRGRPIRVGVPRALLYHEYAALWTAFLAGLGLEVVVSDPTSKSIVDAGVSRVLAENNVNIEDISQTIMQDFFTMMMLVTVDEDVVSIADLQKKLNALAEELDLKITVQHEDIFRYMHRI